MNQNLIIYDTKAVSVYEKIYNYLDDHGVRHSESMLFQMIIKIIGIT